MVIQNSHKIAKDSFDRLEVIFEIEQDTKVKLRAFENLAIKHI